jgi:hypothetical protein
MSLSKDLKAFMKLNIADRKKFIAYGKEVERKAAVVEMAKRNNGVYVYSDAGMQITRMGMKT